MYNCIVRKYNNILDRYLLNKIDFVSNGFEKYQLPKQIFNYYTYIITTNFISINLGY